jgi:peptidoglycan-associated lipoprotein
MTLRQAGLLALAALTLVGCKRRTPAQGPTPESTFAAFDDSMARDRARADSIAAAEATRMRTQREAARAREVLTELIYFEFDSDRLTQESQDQLRAKAAILNANPGVRLRVEGHADDRGSTEYNLALGQRRAEAVRTFLGGFGVGNNRLSTISFGKERPLVEGYGEEVWGRNRRAEFVVTAGEVVSIPAGVPW